MNDEVRYDLVGVIASVVGAAAAAVSAMASSSASLPYHTSADQLLRKMYLVRDQMDLLATDMQLIAEYVHGAAPDDEGHHFAFGQPLLVPRASVPSLRKVLSRALSHCKEVAILALDIGRMSEPVQNSIWADDPMARDVLAKLNVLFPATELLVDNAVSRLLDAVRDASDFTKMRLVEYSQGISRLPEQGF